MAEVKPLVLDSAGFPSQMDPTADSITLNGLTMGGAIAMATNKITGLGAATSDNDALAYGQSSANLAGLDIDTADITMNGRKVTGLGTPTGGGDATTKTYVDQLVISGGSIKEALVHEDQVDDAEGVLSSIAFVMANQPVSGDLVTTTDGTTAREYGAVAGGDVQYALGGSAAVTMQNLVDAINGDGTATCTAALSTDLDAIGSTVVVITEKDNDVGVHKLYGVWATQADADIVNFGGESDYTRKTITDMPAAEPGSTNFGMRRTQASLTDGELHYILNNDVIYGWDDATDTWNALSGSASIPDATGASGGGTKGKATYDTDSGLSVSSGIVSANIDAVTIDFNAGAMQVTGLPSTFEVNGTAVGASVDAPALDTLTDGSNADGEHVHSSSGISLAHDDLSGVTSDQHHAQAHTVASHSDTTATGAELETLTDGSNADALHDHASATATEAPKVENTYNVDAAVSAGDPAFFSSNNEVTKCAADNANSRKFFGVCRTAQGSIGQPTEVVTSGPCAGVLSGATAGDLYYLAAGAGGGISTSRPTTAGEHVLLIGKAINGDDLFVSPQYLGKN